MNTTDETERKETSEQLILREHFQPAKNIIKLPEGLELTSTGILWTGDRDLTPVEWQTIGAAIKYMKRQCGWWELDWWVYGEKKYGDLTKLADAIGYKPKTLHNKSSVARQVPPSRRREGVEISKHAEVAALEPADQVKWLTAAAEHKLSKQALRESIKRGQIIRGVTGKGIYFALSDILDTRDEDGNVVIGVAAVALAALLKRVPQLPLQNCEDAVTLRLWIQRLEPYVNLQSVCHERLQSIGQPIELPTNELQSATSDRSQNVEVADLIDPEIKSWLLHCPASDENFKGNLREANAATIKAALVELPSDAPKNARSAMESRLRRLRKSTNGNAASHNGGREATDPQLVTGDNK